MVLTQDLGFSDVFCSFLSIFEDVAPSPPMTSNNISELDETTLK